MAQRAVDFLRIPYTRALRDTIGILRRAVGLVVAVHRTFAAICIAKIGLVVGARYARLKATGVNTLGGVKLDSSYSRYDRQQSDGQLEKSGLHCDEWARMIGS